MNRDIAEVMLPVFDDPSDEAELKALDQRVRDAFPPDFENVALIRRQDLEREDRENGFRQELIAYWEGMRYIYVYVVMHQRDDGIVAMVFNFNSAFDELNSQF